MSNEYILTTDDNGDLAVRTVVAEESSTANSTDVITATTDGKLAIRVVGSGGSGGDSHNKGYFATQAALEEAYPTGEAGDYAIVGSTDTVWIWDDDNSEWVDTDTKGEVTSVNGQTGAVVLNADDVGAVPQYSSMPEPNQAGDIVQYIGTTNQNYTNGYFYKSTATGSDIVSGTATVTEYINGEGNTPSVIPTFIFDKSVFDAYLVSQSEPENTGTTVTFSWEADDETGDTYLVATYNTNDKVHTELQGETGSLLNDSYAVLGFTTDFLDWDDPDTGTEAVEQHIGTLGHITVSLPTESTYAWERTDVQPNSGGAPYEYTAELEFTPNVDTEGAIIIELAGDNIATLQIGQYVSYEDGGVWDDPVEDAVYTAFMQPSLDTSVGASKILWTSPGNRLIWMDGYAGTGQNEESILTLKYQYGDSGLAEDHCKIVLKIVSDKELTIRATKDPSEFVMDIGAGIMSLPIPLYQESDQTMFYPVQQGGVISWEPIPQVESLPSQTGNSGKFLTTDGIDASWSDKPLVNTATGTNSLTILGTPTSSSNATNIGVGAAVSSFQGTALGRSASCTGTRGLAAGFGASARGERAIQLGYGDNTNNDTFKVANNNGNFEIMSADGTIPTARLTKVNTTVTLTAAGWSSNTQTVTVTGMTATGVVLVSPDPTDQSAYTSAGIICSAQAAGTLTFTCSTTPSADLSVNVVML